MRNNLTEDIFVYLLSRNFALNTSVFHPHPIDSAAIEHWGFTHTVIAIVWGFPGYEETAVGTWHNCVRYTFTWTQTHERESKVEHFSKLSFQQRVFSFTLSSLTTLVFFDIQNMTDGRTFE
jgi:hypothetical protein